MTLDLPPQPLIRISPRLTEVSCNAAPLCDRECERGRLPHDRRELRFTKSERRSACNFHARYVDLPFVTAQFSRHYADSDLAGRQLERGYSLRSQRGHRYETVLADVHPFRHLRHILRSQ